MFVDKNLLAWTNQLRAILNVTGFYFHLFLGMDVGQQIWKALLHAFSFYTELYAMTDKLLPNSRHCYTSLRLLNHLILIPTQ